LQRSENRLASMSCSNDMVQLRLSPCDAWFLDTPAETDGLTPDREGFTILIAQRGRLFLTESTRHELMHRAAEWQRCGGASVEGARHQSATTSLGGLEGRHVAALSKAEQTNDFLDGKRRESKMYFGGLVYVMPT
jgi:hypothetical protein